MPQRHVRRLHRHSPLTAEAAEELAALAPLRLRRAKARDDVVAEELAALAPLRLRRAKARDDVVAEGEPRQVLVVVEGWACRYRLLPDGRRSILVPLLPGDPCPLPAAADGLPAPPIGALSDVLAHEFREQDILELAARHPSLEAALERAAAVDAAMLRERVVSLGQRTACERLAHFLCETFHRLDAIGFCQGDACPFPMTQTDMADVLGLTTVHVNRTLQALRGTGLVELRGRRLGLPRLDDLRRMALFDPAYLDPLRSRPPCNGAGPDHDPPGPGPAP